MKMTKCLVGVLVTCLLAIFTGCSNDLDYVSTAEQLEIDAVIIEDYIASEGLDAQNIESTGIYMAITEEGTVDTDSFPDLTSVITCTCKGYLVDGTVFAESEADSTITFKLGNTILGLQIAIAKLTVGDKATILIPSPYGYGTYSTDDIPANSVLIFDIELVSFDSQLNVDVAIIQDYIEEKGLNAYNIDSTGVYIAITEEGIEDTTSFPTENSIVTCTYKGYYTDETVFDESSSSISFSLQNVIVGWQIAFQELSAGDKATILIPSEYGYGASDYYGIPANSVLIFDVELISFIN